MGLERCGERQVGELEPAGEHVLCRSHAPICEDGGRRSGEPHRAHSCISARMRHTAPLIMCALPGQPACMSGRRVAGVPAKLDGMMSAFKHPANNGE